MHLILVETKKAHQFMQLLQVQLIEPASVLSQELIPVLKQMQIPEREQQQEPVQPEPEHK